jgi:hypothetical protein
MTPTLASRRSRERLFAEELRARAATAVVEFGYPAPGALRLGCLPPCRAGARRA